MEGPEQWAVCAGNLGALILVDASFDKYVLSPGISTKLLIAMGRWPPCVAHSCPLLVDRYDATGAAGAFALFHRLAFRCRVFLVMRWRFNPSRRGQGCDGWGSLAYKPTTPELAGVRGYHGGPVAITCLGSPQAPA